MAGDRVHIGRLQLNIPGVNRDEVDRLEKDLARWLEQHLPISISNRKIEALNLKVSISDATPKNRLAEMIAKRICKSLV